MYKNKDRQKQANKEAKRRERGMTEGMTSGQGMTGAAVVEGVTEGMTDVPEFAKVLAPWTIESIRAALANRAHLGLFDDSSDRWERAVSYYEWMCAGRPVYG